MKMHSMLMRGLLLSLVVGLSACGGDDNDDDIRDLEDRVDAIETRLSTLEANDTSMAAELDGIDTSLADIEARLDSLEGDTSVADELAAIGLLLDEVEARLAEIEGAQTVAFEVSITNLTNNQPLSPVTVILHDDRYRAWNIGYPASLGLESLAESGSPMMLIEAASDAFAADHAADILMPGMSANVTVWSRLSAEDFARGELSLTVVTMPVNTNDAFSGVTGWNVADLRVGEYAHTLTPIYDAGTEANTESMATIPGPAAGGEGYNAARDDIADQVTRHQGVVTADDGFMDSALDQSHRFDQNAMKVVVTRVEI